MIFKDLMTSHLSNLDVGNDGGGAEENNAELGEHFQSFLSFSEQNKSSLMLQLLGRTLADV